MKTLKPLISFIVLILLSGCHVKPHPIAYGTDACHYCSMTIVDQQHAAQFVTGKGKPYTFDSIECMMNQINEGDYKPQLYLVSDYWEPGQLIDAKEAIYLISEKVPSPMGANLSAFRTPVHLQRDLDDFGGKILTWNELQAHFQKP